jgi:two-component system nitrate/nitrite response regulator NarL
MWNNLVPLLNNCLNTGSAEEQSIRTDGRVKVGRGTLAKGGAVSGTSIPIVIIDECQFFREGVAVLLSGYAFRVVGSFARPLDFTASALSEPVSLVLLRQENAEVAAVTAKLIRDAAPACRVAVLFNRASASELSAMAAHGIDACIPMLVPTETLVQVLHLLTQGAIRLIVLDPADQKLSGERLEPPAKASSVGRYEELPNRHVIRGQAPASPKGLLSGRERQILDAVVKGEQNKVIGRKFKISESTVKVHLKSILRKVQAGNRTQAAIWAVEHGFLQHGAEVDGPSKQKSATYPETESSKNPPSLVSRGRPE